MLFILYCLKLALSLQMDLKDKFMKVSILVPVYNVEKYFARCLETLFSQTYSGIEYVFVNDCTPDKSMYVLQETLEKYPSRANSVKIIENKQDALLRVKKEMKQTVTTGTTERNWVTLFKQYENVEELNRRVLMSLVDRILIHENHAIEIVFKYKDEYQQTLEYVLGYADELDIAV